MSTRFLIGKKYETAFCFNPVGQEIISTVQLILIPDDSTARSPFVDVIYLQSFQEIVTHVGEVLSVLLFSDRIAIA